MQDPRPRRETFGRFLSELTQPGQGGDDVEYIPVLSPRIQQVHLVRGQLAVQLFGGAGKGRDAEEGAA